MATDDYVAKWRYEQLRAENERLRKQLATAEAHIPLKVLGEYCAALAAEGATDGG